MIIKKMDQDFVPTGRAAYLAALFDETGRIEVFTGDRTVRATMARPTNALVMEHIESAAPPDSIDAQYVWITPGRVLDLLGVLEEHSVLYGKQATSVRRLLCLWTELKELAGNLEDFYEKGK